MSIQNLNYSTPNLKDNSVQHEVKIQEFFQILNRRKFYLIFSLTFFLALAFLYNFLSKPVFETSVLIKKDKTSPEDLTRIFLTRSDDEIETEIEILKSRKVIEKVVKDLDLYFTINKIITPFSVIQKDKIKLVEYQHRLSKEPGSSLPHIFFAGFDNPNDFKAGTYYLDATRFDILKLYSADNNQLLQEIKNDSVTKFDSIGFEFTVKWAKPSPGSRIIFKVENIDNAVRNLTKDISATALRKTSLFKLSIRSSSPYLAQVITNTMAEKFRVTRLDQRRQVISYKLNFVDNQLKEITENLEETEKNLSNLMSEHQITNIDNVSKKTIEFLSELEAEKIKTGLELTEYRSRYEELKRQLDKNGFIDQTLLTPNFYDRTHSPFSTLLEQLSDAELERLELLHKRTESHPDVQVLDERILKIKNKLRSYNRNTINAYQIIITTLNNKYRDLEILINKHREQERSLPKHETKLVKLIRKKNVYEKIFSLLLDKREEMRMQELSNLQDIEIVDTAHEPLKSILPRKLFNLLLGFFFGIIISMGIIIIKELQNQTIRNVMEIEKEFNLPVLAILPKYNKQLKTKIEEGFLLGNHADLLRDPRLGFKESYRVARTKLAQLTLNRNIIVFTSCEENSGKTTVLANFAVILGLAGKRILVVDCDLKKPKLGEFFYIKYKMPGLIDFLTGKLNTPPIYCPLKDRVRQSINLSVIPAGGIIEDSSELLDSIRLNSFLQEISSSYDYIFIDTPPITMSVDSLVMGNFVKEVILIIHPDLTIKDRLEWAIKDLKHFNIHILGTIVNSCDMKKSGYLHKYGYGYGYKYEDILKFKKLATVT